MKRFRTTLLLLSLALLPALSQADTITLKNGTIIEGTIVSQTDDAVKIEVRVSPTIVDQKVIPRADIAELKVLTEEDRAFESVQNLIPTPPLLKAAAYERLIRSHPERFIAEYPKSQYLAEVKKVLAELEDERARAADGSLKLENTWFTADEQRNDRANIDAKILLYGLRSKALNGDHIGALRDFDKLEAEYKGTESLVAAIPLTLQVLGAYGGTVAASQADFAARMKLREERLQLLPAFRRKENEASFEKELDDHAAAAERDKSRGYRWSAFNANSEGSLKAAAEMIAAERNRVGKLDLEALADAAKSLEQTKAYLQQRKLKSARRSLATASGLIKANGSYYAQVLKNTDRLAAELAKEADAAKVSVSDKAAAKIMAAKGDEAEVASTVNPLQAMMERRKAAAAAAAEKKEKPKPKPKPKPQNQATGELENQRTEMPPPSSGGGISFQTIIFIVAGLLIVTTIGAVLVKKQKG